MHLRLLVQTQAGVQRFGRGGGDAEPGRKKEKGESRTAEGSAYGLPASNSSGVSI